LIGFEHEFLSDRGTINSEKVEKTSKDLGQCLTSLINKLKSKYNVEIIEIEEFNEDRTKWTKKPANISSLSNIKYPRIKLSFSVNSK
jgi:hypothetical protein